MKTLTATSLADLPVVAKQFLSQIGEARILAFDAPMGAGKTTFIKALCDVLGVTDVVNSPTFAIVNEYTDSHGHPIYHFDCYRLKSPQEALDMDCYGYFDSGCFCLIEWPDKLEGLLPEEALLVRIEVQEDGSRCFYF